MTGQPASPEVRIKVADGPDLLQVVPYLLGFCPADSVVFLGLEGEPMRVAATLRLDVDAVDEDALTYAATALMRAGAHSAVTIGYADTRQRAAVAVALAEGGLGRQGVWPESGLLVIDAHWWHLECDAEFGCGECGSPMPPDSPASAAAVAAGLVAAPCRDDVVAALEPVQPDERIDAEADPDRVIAVAAWRRALTEQAAGRAVSDDDIACLIGGLRSVRVRDHCAEAADGPGAHHAEAVVREVARRAPEGWQAAPYSLLSYLAWRRGSGVTARLAADRALAADPACRLALLVTAALDYAIPPTGWEAS